MLCDTGDACYVVAVYDRAAFEAAIGEPLAPNAHRYACVSDTAWYEAEALTGMAPFERGVGRPFGSTMVLKVFGKKVLARQFRALDV